MRGPCDLAAVGVEQHKAGMAHAHVLVGRLNQLTARRMLRAL